MGALLVRVKKRVHKTLDVQWHKHPGLPRHVIFPCMATPRSRKKEQLNHVL